MAKSAGNMLRVYASKALAVLVAACMVVAYVPGLSYAANLSTQDDDEDASTTTTTTTAEADPLEGTCTVDGWTLTFEVEGTVTTVTDSDGTVVSEDAEYTNATITGSDAFDSSAGDGSLSIPSSVELDGTSYPVTAIADKAFRAGDSYNPYAENITALTIPNTLTTLGSSAFRGCTALESVTFNEESSLESISTLSFYGCTSLESISIPASVAYLDTKCFKNCTALAEVTFEGDSLEFLGYAAFSSCTALESITIPPLSGGSASYRYTGSLGELDGYRLGFDCFYGCSSLKECTLLPGASGTTYISDSNTALFEGVADDFALLIYVNGLSERSGHASNTSGVANTSNRYYAISFYASKSAATSDTYGTSADYQALYASGTLISDVLSGEAEPYEGSETGEMPEVTDGMSWSTSDSDLLSDSASVADTIHFYLDTSSLATAYVYIPEYTSTSQSEVYGEQESSAATVFLIDGMQDLSEVVVYQLDGSLVDESDYVLVFQQVTTDDDGNNVYTTVSADDAWEEGTYTVYATGAVDSVYEGTSTAAITFTVSKLTFSLDASTYVGTSRDTILGNVALFTENALSQTASFVTVADANNPQQMLVASWLAGVAGGQAVFTDGEDTTERAYSAILGAGVKRVYVIGGEDAVGSAVVERLTNEGLSLTNFTVSDVDDAEAISLRAFNGLQTINDNYDYGYTWGDVAVVVSDSQSLGSEAIASYVYQACAPVFFTSDDGGISSDTLSALNATDDEGERYFTKVIVVGSEACVSASVVSAIESETGLEVERVGDSDNAFEASVEIQELCNTELVDADGNALASSSGVVIASTAESGYVVSGAQYAAANGYEFIVVSSSADAKAAVSYVAENSVTRAYFVGDFTDIETALQTSSFTDFSTLLLAAYDNPDTSIALGDTIESGGVLYTVASDDEATLTSVLDDGVTSLTLGSVQQGDVEYAVSEIPASFFKGLASLRSVTATVDTIGAQAFAGCTALTQATLKAGSYGSYVLKGCSALQVVSTNTSSIANMFSGCKALTKVTLSSTALKTIPASTFSGCTKLASVSIASTALTTVGKNAFYNCKKLASINLKSTKLTSIGASAFQGCTSLTKATIASTKLTTLGTKAFYGASKLTSINLKSTKLKSISAQAFRGCKKLKTVTIASTALTSVGMSAFYGCSSLTSISLKSTKLTSIGTKAFYKCTALTKATVSSKKLKTIGASAFSGCTKLKTVTLASTSLTSVGKNAFNNCKKLASINLKSTKLTTIGSKAFYNCKALKTITIKSKKLKSVGTKAFKNVYKKVTVKVPSSKKTAYKKLFVKKGLSSKATFKKA